MHFNTLVKSLLEDFNIFPKQVNAVRSTRMDRDQGMTTGVDISNTPSSMKIDLPSAKKLKTLKRKKLSRRLSPKGS